MVRTVPVKFFLYFLFFLSGAAGLGYEIVWTRMFSVGLGHEIPSLLAVLAAFFGGLALGAWSLDKRISQSRFTVRWYAGLELIIGLWSLATVWLIPWANDQAAHLTGAFPVPLRHWTVAFVVPFLTLLPATFCMGATLPTVDRLFSQLRIGMYSIGGLYSANTLGAVAGTLMTTFWIIPAVGMTMTLIVFAGVNLFCAAAVIISQVGRQQENDVDKPDLELPPHPFSRLRLGVTAFATGLLGIGYEVLCVRVMGQSLENTVYSFASALSVYLLLTAAGAAIFQGCRLWRWPTAVLTFLLQATSISCLLGVVILWLAPQIYASIRNTMQVGVAGSIAAEMILALLVFGLPSLTMGATFSCLAQAARTKNGGVGWTLGWNTLGASLAPLTFGVVLLPVFGAKWALATAAISYLLLIPKVSTMRLGAACVPICMCLVLMIFLPFVSLVHVRPPAGGRMLEYREGILGTIAVVEDKQGYRFLKVNDRFSMGGTRSVFGERRQAHIPLLLHPKPRRSLFLGLGTGITFKAAEVHPDLYADGVELIPECLQLMHYFQEDSRNDDGENQESSDRMQIICADARRYVRACEGQYDVIVADLFHPARDGAGSLYTSEHFRAVRDRLSPGGLFCQWLPIYQLDEDTLRVIVRTFLDVFPEASAYLAHFNIDTPAVALIATSEPVNYPGDWYQQRVTKRGLLDGLRESGLADGISLFGCFVGGRDELTKFAGKGLLNTDDRPVVMFAAPEHAYKKSESSYLNLVSLLAARESDWKSILDGSSEVESEFGQRLQRYLEARDLYIQAEIKLAEGQEQQALDVYLDSVRMSSDFGPAYVRALLIAQQRGQRDMNACCQVLRAMLEANPEREEARRLLERYLPNEF